MIKNLIIDIDGVLTKDKNLTPFEDTPAFIEFLRKNNVKFKIATNNSLYSPDQLVERLNQNGIKVKRNEVITPLVVLPEYLIEKDISKVFVIGNQNLKNYLTSLGKKVSEDTNVDAVVIGQDKDFNFKKMKIATTAIKESNAQILALNANLITKDDDGLLFPGVGSVAQMFAYATKKEWIHFGKNSPYYNKYLLEEFPKNEEIWIISDDIFTDLIPFSKLGLKTIFITTGKYKLEDLPPDFSPDLIVDSLTQLIEKLKDDKKD